MQLKEGDLRMTALPVVIVDWEDGNPLGGATHPVGARLPRWFYVGGGTFALDGANPQQLAVPADAAAFQIRARGGEVYYNINGITASAASPGYVPTGGIEIVGPLDNLGSLWIFSATVATVCHFMWFREA